MKFKVTMKDPDQLGDATDDAVRADIALIAGLSDDDREALYANRRNDVSKITAKWFKWGEYLTVEIDTDTQTATVCPAE